MENHQSDYAAVYRLLSQVSCIVDSYELSKLIDNIEVLHSLNDYISEFRWLIFVYRPLFVGVCDRRYFNESNLQIFFDKSLKITMELSCRRSELCVILCHAKTRGLDMSKPGLIFTPTIPYEEVISNKLSLASLSRVTERADAIGRLKARAYYTYTDRRRLNNTNLKAK
jgi:hypothetical protein